MKHEIMVVIESEKEWKAVCALSSLVEKPLSELAKSDLVTMTRYTAEKIKNDKDLHERMESRNHSQFKMLIDILDV